jgi:hypothetical protein
MHARGEGDVLSMNCLFASISIAAIMQKNRDYRSSTYDNAPMRSMPVTVLVTRAAADARTTGPQQTAIESGLAAGTG